MQNSVIIWATTWQNQQSECAPSQVSDQPGHPPSLFKSSLCAQRVAKDPSFLHADSEDSDQTGRMPRLIWVFAGRNLILLGFVMSRLVYPICQLWMVDSSANWTSSFVTKGLLIYLMCSVASDQIWLLASKGLKHTTNVTLASDFRNLGKQCKPRSDATESGSILFAYRSFYLKQKWKRPLDTPKTGNRLVQSDRMEESTRLLWVKTTAKIVSSQIVVSNLI